MPTDSRPSNQQAGPQSTLSDALQRLGMAVVMQNAGYGDPTAAIGPSSGVAGYLKMAARDPSSPAMGALTSAVQSGDPIMGYLNAGGLPGFGRRTAEASIPAGDPRSAYWRALVSAMSARTGSNLLADPRQVAELMMQRTGGDLQGMWRGYDSKAPREYPPLEIPRR